MIGSIADTPALLRGETGTVVTRDADGLELADVAQSEEAHLNEQAAESGKKSGFKPVGLHDPVRADRPGGDRDLDHPGGHVRPERGRRVGPRDGHEVEQSCRGSSSTRSPAPINGMYGIEDAAGNINYYNPGVAFERSTWRCSSS